METDGDRNNNVSSPEPKQSADPGSDLLFGSTSSLDSPETGAALNPAPPSADPDPSDPFVDTSVTSQLLAPAVATCPSQLIIVEQRGDTLPAERMVIVTGQSEGREVFVIPSNQLAVISSSPTGPVVNIPVTTVTDFSSSRPPREQPANGSSPDVSAGKKPRLSGVPSWALRLRNVQKLGDSFRGFCCSEAELEAILLLHKQQTGCVFGTRQSPSVDKPATRLMWKSQYVPYDGIPFVNTGSRAIVMECQFGPRRKGLQSNRNCDLPADTASYRATCPARIYIKKVRKFPDFRVPTEETADRRTVRQEQEKAFQSLKNQNLETGGVIRFYLQLPTERAHLYHTVDTPPIPPPPPDLSPPPTQPEEEEEEEAGEQDGAAPSRLHPRVAERIRQLVAAGHHQVYTVRKQLRRFVEKELFKCDGLPERHNLRFFPTVNDIKNHIHESQKALGLTAATAAEWTEDSTDPLMETVTLTLTPAAEGVDGTESLSPEAVQLFSSLSSLQPRIFAQLQGILQPLPPPPPPPLSPSLLPVVSPSSFLQPAVGESEEELHEGQQLCGGAQQEVQLQIINSPDTTEDALIGGNVLQVEVKEEEEEMKMKEMEDFTGSC
ncbi:calcium-responsive transcription factor-like isoform X1 [Epinephelus moara]|uniref:calcium-responsive transcription factor-like isoform X1 n=1 Tax=Epinephelus moara TaxID=300413 RepID=UPI00214EE45D|nr:calcium-responsive transcription factor-like isoform X1 [Epinephelus moara]XP_049905212.1 calcium-responsive transcription factor-like isoform X1 [Epinephelus moara]XP_049905213.1 calcium-responsive transcription factor-like isoform X1 [Epinephelus moara]